MYTMKTEKRKTKTKIDLVIYFGVGKEKKK